MFRAKSFILIGILVLFLVGFMGCEQQQAPQQTQLPKEKEVDKPVTEAVAILHPTEGYEVSGIVRFSKVKTELGEEIKVVADVEGLSPGDHGFHIHQFGDCRANADSAGVHFNPEDKMHGPPTAEEKHLGDLGNLEADENGKAHYEFSFHRLAFDGLHSIIGRAVVVHKNPDDFTTQPFGNSGDRIACGVIGIEDEKPIKPVEEE
jgi:Cu-Zn family superoxide dismutase